MKYLLIDLNKLEEEVQDFSELSNEKFEELAEKSGKVVNSSADFESEFNSERINTNTDQLRIVENN